MRALFVLLLVAALVLIVTGEQGWLRFVVAAGVAVGCVGVLVSDQRRERERQR